MTMEDLIAGPDKRPEPFTKMTPMNLIGQSVFSTSAMEQARSGADPETNATSTPSSSDLEEEPSTPSYMLICSDSNR